MEAIEAKPILVVDIQPNTTTAEAEQLLNEPFSRGFYLVSILGGFEHLGARAFYRLRAEKADDGKEEAETRFVKDHMDLSRGMLAAELKKAGMPRSTTWVGTKKAELFVNGTKR